MTKSHDGRKSSVESGNGIREWETKAQRRSAGFRHHIPKATHGFGDGPKSPSVAVGAGLPVRGYVDHNELWMELAQLLVVQTPSGHTPGTKIFNNDIAL